MPICVSTFAEPIPAARPKVVPAPALAAKAVSNAVLMYSVFDPMKETSREEKVFETKCRAFAGLTDYHVTMNGSVVAQFDSKETANKCADKMHGYKFGGGLIVCDFVAGKDDLTPMLPREIVLGNVFTPAQVRDPPLFWQRA